MSNTGNGGSGAGDTHAAGSTSGSVGAQVLYYGYTPSVALAAVGITFFTILFLAHTARTVRSRAPYTILLPSCCLLELLGCIFRLASARLSPYKASWFAAQYFFLAAGPAAAMLCLYLALTRAARVLGDDGVGVPYGWGRQAPHRRAVHVLTAGDVCSVVILIAGSVLFGQRTQKTYSSTTADYVVLAGFVVQIFIFFVYIPLHAVTLQTVLRSRSKLGREFTDAVVVIVAASVLLLLRLTFRIALAAKGARTPIATHEAYFGALDVAPVIIALALLTWQHPGSALRRKPQDLDPLLIIKHIDYAYPVGDSRREVQELWEKDLGLVRRLRAEEKDEDVEG